MSLMENGEAKLREKLFKTGYNPELRPVLNRSSKVTVKLGVSLHQIIDVVNDLYYSKFEEAYEYAIWFSQLYHQFFFYHCLSGLSPPQEGGAYALAS